MAEKTGNLIKLTYDFESSRSCEVSIDGEKWARVTAREFRSWNGERRILNIDDPNEAFYEEYKGPIYYYGTNRKSQKTKTNGITFFQNKDPREQLRPKGSFQF
jgi:hypothetical protein